MASISDKRIVFFNRSSIHYRKNIYELLDRELKVCFFFGDSRPGDIKPVDVSVLSHFKGYIHNISLGPFYWQRGVLKLLRSEYSVFLTPGDTYCLSTWLMLLLARTFNKKIYLWTHGAYGNEVGLKRTLALLRVKLSTGLFLYGNYAKDILERWGASPQKLHVIYNSLSYDEQIPIRSQLTPSLLFENHFNNSWCNLVFIGRLTRVKKLDQTLKAVAILRDQNVNVNITFIGDGAIRDSLESITKELSIEDRVWFYGACYDEKAIAEFLYNADVCVSPGNVGLTAMHAMTFGCPVISHNNFPMQMPEFEAIEEGKTGAFFIENDVEDLARAIKNWFDSAKDRDVIRNNCYRVIDEKYNPHVQINVFKNAILGE